MNKKLAFSLILVFSTFLGAVGQFFFKLGLEESAYAEYALIFLGICAYLLSTLFYFFVLGRTQLSWAYSFIGLSYIFTLMLASVFLHERVHVAGWIGVALIFLGTALIGKS
ncbi:MAG: EamA family transporter [Candidatus Micrarchaeaceae archaeon]